MYIDDEINKNNKLIAEFMNDEAMLLKTAVNPNGVYHRMKSGHQGYEPLKYYESWDWVMPVVDKIDSMDYIVEICNKQCRIYDFKNPLVQWKRNRLFPNVGETNLEATYKTIIEFIKYYNNGERK